MGDKSFIEVQFPVSKISKESYKERKANLGQTLTGLGKWWGRKPLILVRATILGLLLPATDNPVKDREIYLKLLTMDEDGLLKRKTKSLSTKDIYRLLDNNEKEKYFVIDDKGIPKYIRGIKSEEKKKLQKICFNRLSYDEKIKLCCRPEELDNVLSKEEWDDINNYLGTNADSLQSLVNELGIKKFGHTPIVGDCFAGGGSIPFEAARMGCEVYASDLNPIACLLTWADLNILSKSDEEIDKLREFQQKVYDEVDRQIQEWGIETNEEGDRAISYLYCNEAVCPECGYLVPLSPTWVVGKGTKTIAILKDNGNNGYDIEIKQGVTHNQLKECEKTATIKSGKMICPHCKTETAMSVIRNDREDNEGNEIYGIRKWSQNEFINKSDDVFRERLYCIKYVKQFYDKKGNLKELRYYKAPDKYDIEREDKVINILKQNFLCYKENDFIPSMKIENGEKTDEPIRTRGWQYWHQLFNPRQLLINSIIFKGVYDIAVTQEEGICGLLSINRCINSNSKLCTWHPGIGNEKVETVFINQALNPLYNYGCRSLVALQDNLFLNIKNKDFISQS
ncbi:MAG: DUF1156 domain-containing protein, partial [Romboutsia timonensis]|uniref:DUF1156 domain-containing protein n=1 Tax=Romboutsia timonensis TaxID=1776391 RepID=UPI002A75A99B